MGHARRRNADILAEIIGFATFSAPENIANPDSQTIADCMECSMNQAQVNADDVDYVSAHATATIQGDIAEAQAIGAVMGDKVPVSSLKGHLGHTMAASGAMELIASIRMMRYNILIPTRNLVTPDPECNMIDFVVMPRESEINIILKNSFALGGINSAILIRRYRND
jgi:3-oxoacyl-[acyl-carrier-protein] synthase II